MQRTMETNQITVPPLQVKILISEIRKLCCSARHSCSFRGCDMAHLQTMNPNEWSIQGSLQPAAFDDELKITCGLRRG